MRIIFVVFFIVSSIATAQIKLKSVVKRDPEVTKPLADESTSVLSNEAGSGIGDKLLIMRAAISVAAVTVAIGGVLYWLGCRVNAKFHEVELK